MTGWKGADLRRRQAKVETEAPVPGRAAWWAISVLTLLYAVSLLDRQILSLLIKPIRADLHISDFQISILQGFAFALFYSIFGLPFGAAADRWSRRWIIFVGVSIWGVAACACGLAHNYPQMLLARFAMGAGEAALLPAAFSLLADYFPKRRLALALSIFAAGATIGSGLALVGGGQLIDHLPKAGASVPLLGRLAAWQIVFLLTGLPGVAFAWLALTLPKPDLSRHPQAPAPRLADLARQLGGDARFYVGHFIGFSLISMTGYGFLVWTPTYMVRKFGWSIGTVGFALAVAIAVAGSIGPILLGVLVDRLFHKGMKDAHLRVFIVTGILEALILIAAMATNSAPVFLVLATANLGLCSFTGASAAALQIVTPRPFRGQVSAAYAFCLALLGAGCGPSLVAAFTDFVYRSDAMVGWSIASTFAVCIPLSAACLWWAAAPMRRAVARQDGEDAPQHAPLGSLVDTPLSEPSA